MQDFIDFIKKIITADSVALFSVVATILIYLFTRQSELRYRKYEEKKEQYLKLIKFLAKIYLPDSKDKKGNLVITDQMKQEFFDTGSSLVLYGSKKLYKNYLLFREFTSNPLIKCCRYYTDNLITFVIADIFKCMRKEVGLNIFNSISSNEALAFFINDVNIGPVNKIKGIKSDFSLKMVRLELWFIDQTKGVLIKNIFYFFVMPILGCFSIILKYLIMIPFGKMVEKMFPKFARQVEQENEEKNEKTK